MMLYSTNRLYVGKKKLHHFLFFSLAQNLLNYPQIADCSWDKTIKLYTPTALAPPPPPLS